MLTHNLTFSRLCELEPALRLLERRVIARAGLALGKRNWCSNSAWYGFGRFDFNGLKEPLVRLIGHHRQVWHGAGADPAAEELLRSSLAYDTAYDHLYALLPACRGCGCL